MKIGIDGSRAFIKNRTGIEEYSYQAIKHFRNCLSDEQVILYIRKNQKIDFELPQNWKVKTIKFSRFWTQMGLSLEMFFHPVDSLFVPAHTVPVIHPEKTIVVVHGLEYEFCSNSYSFWDRIYMRISIKNSCRWASKIISVSENTKKDLVDLYKVPCEKIHVVYEGYGNSYLSSVSNRLGEKKDDQLLITNDKYLLFIGRIEERKNVGNIIEAFEILKEKNKIPHKLVLAGKPGFGYENLKFKSASWQTSFKFKDEVLELGFVSEEEKWGLLKKADVFVFPTLYEGFGIPVLEAQSVGCPVVASNNSSIPEVVGDSALLVDPQNPEEIAKAVVGIILDQEKRKDLIEKGRINVERFSWENCAKEIVELLYK